MPYQAELKFDERLIKRAVRCYWWHSLTGRYWAAVLFLLGMFVWYLASGDRSWLIGFLAAVVMLGVGMPVVVYLVHFRNSMAKLRAMKHPTATFLATEDSFTITTDSSASTLEWKMVREVWCFESLWLLLFSKAHFITLPLDGVSEEMQAYILDRVASAGGRIAK